MLRTTTTYRSAATLLAFSLTLLGCSIAEDPASEASSPEILWDTWGVPHIYAPDAAGLFYGFGWAQAKSHGDLVLRLMAQSRGRAAQYWGEEHLELDRWVWTMGIPARADSWYAQQEDEIRGFLDAFADGFNDYAGRHSEAIAEEMRVVLPLNGRDLLAHLQRVLHFTFVTNPQEIGGHRRRLADAPGSNAWAISPQRSASGNAILVANPHLPWHDLFTFYEAHLSGPEVDVYGTTVVGMPFPAIAFNNHLGWSHTVNIHDGDDLFLLNLQDDGYLFDGETRAFRTEEVILQVAQGDGTTREESFRVLHSVHGPVVASNGQQALALRVVGLDAPHLLRQYWEMIRATDLEAFESAIRQMQMPMFTFMYADREGNILHHFGGQTPRRSQGDWATWARPVPGDDSRWLWTDVHSFDELPTVNNPDSGWLQNANDPPWTTTFPPAIDADDYPAYMSPRFMHFRAQRSAAMLADDDSVTFEEAVEYKLSSRMELADRLLDDLEQAVAEHGDETARAAMTVLSDWDRTADADSRGGVLFQRFCEEMGARGQGLLDRTGLYASGFGRPWSETEPRTTPDGLADARVAAEALSTAAQVVTDDYGRLDVAWGEVHRLRRAGHDYPANGGPGELGVFSVIDYGPPESGTVEAVKGDSYIAIVEFSDPVRAEVLLTYGNATQPGSPHNGDQLQLYSRKELRPVWRQRTDIEAHLEEYEKLDPGS